EIGGKQLDTGAYAIYTIPGKSQWEIIVNKGLKNWGVSGFKDSEDIVRFKATPVTLNDNVETFTMQFINVKPESCELQLAWEKTSVSFPIIALNVKEK